MRTPIILSVLSTLVLVASCSSAPQAESPANDTQATAEQSQTSSDSTQLATYVEDGVAIQGADPVAYFTESDYVQGSDEFTHEWNGATWYFSSAENRDLFASDPEKYAPQYGGFCAWAVSQGSTAPIDPTAWKIVDGKLYLNLNKEIQARWEQDIPGNIAKADENWPEVVAN